ncbi:MAG: monovalent cation/H(+) antiporter subunit G [Myxococcales bacterium]|jgi:multicomponent Na+:H+ antiporter subunit G
MELALEIGSWICLTVGSAFCAIGGIGILRLPDLYTRTHAASITDTLGAGLLLLGLGLQAGLSLVSVKLLMVYAFMLITGPAASHALVKAAYAQGVKADVEEEHPRSLRPRPDEIGG